MTPIDKIEHASQSDVGVRRSLNEDNHAFLLASDEEKWASQGHFFLVADGMGGHAVGELASEMAAAHIPHTYSKHAELGPSRALRRAFQEANAAIFSRGQQNPDFKEMGTTATALLLRPEGAWAAHVGDSRLYRIRAGFIEQLTFDHSHVWDIARRLQVNPEDVAGISSNLLMRSLGPQALAQVDVEGPHPVRADDIFLLCSDGLSGQVSDPELGAVAGALPPAEACRFLIDLANLRGGPDNITVTIVRVGLESPAGPGAAPAAPVRKPLHRLVPWPLLLQCAGLLLALAAGLLTFYQLPGGKLAFLLAAGVIAAGLVGLLLQYNREKKQVLEEDDEQPELHVYRRAPCPIDRAILAKLARASEALRQRAQEKQWDPDWTTYQRHRDLADERVRAGDPANAFAEYCRAMRPLCEALSRHRQREETLEHVWDKER